MLLLQTLSLQRALLIVTGSQHSTEAALPVIQSRFFCGLGRAPEELPMTAFSQASLPLSFCTSEANWIAGSYPASLSCSVALLCLASSVFVKPSVGSQTRIQQLQINSWGFWVLGFVLFFFSGFSLKNVKNGRNWLGLSGGCFLEGPVLSSRPKHLSLASFSSSSCGSPAAGQFVALLSHHCRVLPPPAC